MLKKENLAIYIHWPFCLSLCPYCDFNSHVSSNIDADEWLKAYLKEISVFEELIKERKITSIFFGGGTPSLMPPIIVKEIIAYLKSLSPFEDIEITLEANPTSSEGKKFEEFKTAGINRLSIGVQSFNDESLKFLGRKHNALEAIEVIKTAKGIFENYSFDLIYARPDQGLSEWEDELNFALKLASKHISLYQLTIEKGTEFYKLHKENKLKTIDNDRASQLFDLTNNLLNKHGFARYEISNYAQKGYECRHNISYWKYDNYLGIGPGAHSRITDSGGTYAMMMQHNPTKWLNLVNSGSTSIQNKIYLSLDEIIHEVVMMGLRISEGISEKALINKTTKNFEQIFEEKYIQQFIHEKLLEYNCSTIKLTNKGMDLHSYITSRIIKENL